MMATSPRLATVHVSVPSCQDLPAVSVNAGIWAISQSQFKLNAARQSTPKNDQIGREVSGGIRFPLDLRSVWSGMLLRHRPHFRPPFPDDVDRRIDEQLQNERRNDAA